MAEPATAPALDFLEVELPEGFNDPIGEEFEIRPMVLPMGPSHPAMHGTVRIVLKLEGETVVDADVQVGYLHRGFEKECESGTWEQAIPYTDRLNYNSAIICNLGYCLAVEKLLGIEVPVRAQALRVLASELSRMGDHFTCVGAGGLELGAMSAFLYAVEAREMLWDLVEDLCGARVTNNYVRIGGLSQDLRDGFPERLKATFVKVRELYDDVDKLLTANRIFVDRLKNTGLLSKERAIAWGQTGPVLRATGVPYDIRKAFPYSGYERYDFDIPVGSVGDNYDRFLIRMEELKQSMRIIEQVLGDLPGGPVNVDDPKVRWPAKSRVFTRMEELIDQFMLVTGGIRVPAGEGYVAVEGANGELGFYVVSDGSGHPVKMRCRSPSFANTSALREMIIGSMIADIIPTFDLLNMIGGECDR